MDGFFRKLYQLIERNPQYYVGYSLTLANLIPNNLIVDVDLFLGSKHEMLGFVKVLKSNESGYSGDEPNQRGKFILVSKKCLRAFPPLSESILNSQSTIKCLLPNSNLVGLNIVYHNAKFFPSHQRNHDEVRIYRNNEFDEGLNPDRNVLIIFFPNDDHLLGSFNVVSLREGDHEFDLWKKFDSKTFEIKQVQKLTLTKELMARSKDNNLDRMVENFKHVIQNVAKFSEGNSETGSSRTQQEAAQGDPALALSTLINSQGQFSKYIREVYDFKCCLRKNALINTSGLGLEAAHIKAHSNGGPLLPTNGILLSADLHRIFDAGGLSLYDDGAVKIHSSIPKSSGIWDYEKFKICPKPGYELYAPYKDYIEFHRENVFSRFEN